MLIDKQEEKMLSSERNNVIQGGFEKDKPLSKRELTRLLAIMVVYIMQYNNQTKTQALQAVLSNNLWQDELDSSFKYPKVDELFLMELVDGVLENQIMVDSLISNNLNNSKTSIEVMDKLMLSVIKIACFEIINQQVANQIICKQYSFLANCFFNPKESVIVNRTIENIIKSSVQ